MSDEDLEKIRELIKDNAPASSNCTIAIFLMLLFFINGCFNGCGY